MQTSFKEKMLGNYWLILSLLGIVYGSPYYYREDKHHSEHHKEYSYSNGQPSSINTYEPSPQKYYEGSHFSSHVTPQRYYKLETSPSFSSGLSQYSGGLSSFHQSGFQSSGIQSGHLHSLPTGQTFNVDGIKPGTYVIKNVKVYGQPSVYKTTFFGPSGHNSQLDGGGLETGQREDSLYTAQHEDLGQKEMSSYEGQHEDTTDSRSGEYVKHEQTRLYHQAPTAVQLTHRQEESIYGQKVIDAEDLQINPNVRKQIKEISGQKEGSLYNQQTEELSQQQGRGDIEIGQNRENPNIQNSHLAKIVQTYPLNNGLGGYKYYEKKVVTYGTPVKDSSIYKQVYVHKPMQNPESLSIQRTNKSHGNYENVHSISKQQTENIRYSQEAVELGKRLTPPGSQTHYSNPGYPAFIPNPKDVKFLSFQDQEVPKSLLGKTTELNSYTGPQTENKKEERVYGQHTEDLGQHAEDLGQQAEDLGQHAEDLGQQLEHGSFEIGQQLDNDHQQLETENIDEGQKEDSMERQFHTWQKQVNTSRIEVSGQRTEPEIGNFRQPQNNGHLSTGSLEIGQEQTSHDNLHFLVKQNVTRTSTVGHNLPNKPASGRSNNEKNLGQREDSLSRPIEEMGSLELGQKEENLGQLETGDLGIGQQEETLEIKQQLETFGQHPETGDLLTGQKEESLHLKIPENDNLQLGQKEESAFDIEQDKAFPYNKLTETSTKQPRQNEIAPYLKTYNQHKSYYNEFEQTQGKDIQKYGFTTKSSSTYPEGINKNHRTNYFELQQKAEELAQQLGIEDNTKEKSSQQEKDLYDEKITNNEKEATTSSTTEVYAAEIQELGRENQHSLEESSKISEARTTTWKAHREEHGLHQQQPSKTSYTSKKHSKHYYQENQGYNTQPKPQNYAYQGESLHSSHYGSYPQGYSQNGGERTYISDQPIQRSHLTQSQFLSSSGSSQDKHKAIDDFLKELEKDISRNNYQQRQQQGSYAEITPSRPGSSGVTYYSQRTVSSHSNSSYSSSGTSNGGDTAKSWFQRIGDSIGSSYNKAKDRATEIVKTVKHSAGYSNQ